MDVSKQAITTSVATIHTREIVQSQANNVQMLSSISIPQEWRIDAQPFINRPFFAGSVTWNNTSPANTLLPNTITRLPGDIIRSNTSLLNAMKMAAYYRQKLHLNITLAGTITHAGCILVSVIPPINGTLSTVTSQKALVNTMLSGPHAFLHANEATSVDLAVPWYCNTDVASLDMQVQASSATDLSSFTLGNYATLLFYVLNPLAPSTGSSNSLTITIDAVFHNLDMLVPTSRYVGFVSQSLQSVGTALIDSGFSYVKKAAGDALDAARGEVRELTGLHNPNMASINEKVVIAPKNYLNVVDTIQYFEKLDPFAHRDRILSEPIFNTDVDEMQFKHILGKKQYITSFTVKDVDPVGKLLYARPISPYQGGLTDSDVVIANNIEQLYWLSRAWSGSIKITIQSVMNNKQQVKLRLFNMYNVSKSSLTGYPLYKDILNSPSHLLEFTAGGQSHEVELPFLCRTEQLYSSRDLNYAALMHGMYYIYVAQPLANSADSPTTVSFNVYISAENVKFYGYSTDAATRANSLVSLNTFKSESINVMNEPADQNKLNTTIDNTKEALDNRQRLVQIIDCRPIIRRMYKTTELSALVPPQDVQAFQSYSFTCPLSFFTSDTFHNFFSHTPMEIISTMFYGKTAGLKFRLIPVYKYEIAPTLRYRVYYVPPDQVYDVASSSYYASTVTSETQCPAMEVTSSINDFLEFEIPNLNVFKFIGSPDKFTEPVTGFNAFSDLGHLLIQVENVSPGGASALTFQVWTALTDESRLGFHCIAPSYTYSTGGQLNSTYSGLAGAQLSAARNKYIYFP